MEQDFLGGERAGRQQSEGSRFAQFAIAAHGQHEEQRRNRDDRDQFTRQAPVRLLLAIGKYAEPTDTAILQFADENYPLFQQQRARLERAAGPRTGGKLPRSSGVTENERDSYDHI
jgi:hypothetical protein